MPVEELPRSDGKRKRVLVRMDAENRDRGKAFLITEMPATQAERWFRKVLARLARLGVSPPAMADMIGAAAIASFNPIQLFAWLDDEDLIREVMSCVQRQEDGAPMPRFLDETDAEEVLTLLRLKLEVFALHVGFSTAVVLWVLAPGLAAAMNLPPPEAPKP